jgi:hypothetical protein
VAHAQYSFALPVGFALGGGSTSVAGTPAPFVGGAAVPAVGSGPVAGVAASVPGAPAPPIEGVAPSAGAPASLARESAPNGESGWPEGLPIGLRQDQDRVRSREALMRSGAPPRRGRVEEGTARGALSRLSPRPPDPPAPGAGLGPAALATLGTTPRPAESQPGGAPDMEELCEELIARLRRELLVERERMGTLFGV